MFQYTYDELFKLIDKYNKKHGTNINVNELVDPNFFKFSKLGRIESDKFKKFSPKVIYEDNDFFGIYKPPFWVVNVGCKPTYLCDVHKNMNRGLLQVWLYKNLNYPLRNSLYDGYGISNRLDITTSGIVIVAKNKKNYDYMRKEISSHKNTRKKYFTLVVGNITSGGTIETDISCNKTESTARCYNSTNGQYSKTEYLPIAHLKDSDGHEFTLLDVRIFTGRTHQIRVHMKMLNTHIVGDDVYSKDVSEFNHQMTLVDRLFLHAYYYTFLNMEGKRVEIFSPLADDLVNAIKNNFTIEDKNINKDDLIKLLENPKDLQNNQKN